MCPSIQNKTTNLQAVNLFYQEINNQSSHKVLLYPELLTTSHNLHRHISLLSCHLGDIQSLYHPVCLFSCLYEVLKMHRSLTTAQASSVHGFKSCGIRKQANVIKTIDSEVKNESVACICIDILYGVLVGALSQISINTFLIFSYFIFGSHRSYVWLSSL